VKQPASYKVETVQVPYAAPMLQQSTLNIYTPMCLEPASIKQTSVQVLWVNINEVLVKSDVILRVRTWFLGHKYHNIAKERYISTSQCSFSYLLSKKLLPVLNLRNQISHEI